MLYEENKNFICEKLNEMVDSVFYNQEHESSQKQNDGPDQKNKSIKKCSGGLKCGVFDGLGLPTGKKCIYNTI